MYCNAFFFFDNTAKFKHQTLKLTVSDLWSFDMLVIFVIMWCSDRPDKGHLWPTVTFLTAWITGKPIGQSKYPPGFQCSVQGQCCKRFWYERCYIKLVKHIFFFLSFLFIMKACHCDFVPLFVKCWIDFTCPVCYKFGQSYPQTPLFVLPLEREVFKKFCSCLYIYCEEHWKNMQNTSLQKYYFASSVLLWKMSKNFILPRKKGDEPNAVIIILWLFL